MLAIPNLPATCTIASPASGPRRFSIGAGAYEEVCGNLMIFQQLEPICQPINNTFCMEFTQLHYNILLIFLLICYNTDSQTARERVLLCESNGTSNNT